MPFTKLFIDCREIVRMGLQKEQSYSKHKYSSKSKVRIKYQIENYLCLKNNEMHLFDNKWLTVVSPFKVN